MLPIFTSMRLLQTCHLSRLQDEGEDHGCLNIVIICIFNFINAWMLNAAVNRTLVLQPSHLTSFMSRKKGGNFIYINNYEAKIENKYLERSLKKRTFCCFINWIVSKIKSRLYKCFHIWSICVMLIFRLLWLVISMHSNDNK